MGLYQFIIPMNKKHLAFYSLKNNNFMAKFISRNCKSRKYRNKMAEKIIKKNVFLICYDPIKIIENLAVCW